MCVMKESVCCVNMHVATSYRSLISAEQCNCRSQSFAPVTSHQPVKFVRSRCRGGGRVLEGSTPTKHSF
jgi:hypothetical protein